MLVNQHAKTAKAPVSNHEWLGRASGELQVKLGLQKTIVTKIRVISTGAWILSSLLVVGLLA